VKAGGLALSLETYRAWISLHITHGKCRTLFPTTRSSVCPPALPSPVIAEPCGYVGVFPASPRTIQGLGSLRAMSLKPPLTVYDDGSVRSIASLGSFPEPPNHFPIPPLTGSFSSNSATNSPTIQHSISHSDGAMQIRTSSDVSGSSSDPLPRVTESPLEEIAAAPVLTDRSLPPDSSQDPLAAPFTTPAQNGKNASSAVTEGPGANSEDNDDVPSFPTPNTAPQRSSPPGSMPPPPIPLPITQSRQQHDPTPSVDSRSKSATGSRSAFKRGDYLDDREFGVDDSTETTALRAKTLDSPHSRIDRSDTSRSNGNMVAAIRDRYTRAVSCCFLCLGCHLYLFRRDQHRHRLEIFLDCRSALRPLRQSISPRVVNPQFRLDGRLGLPPMTYRKVLVIQGRAPLFRSKRSSSHQLLLIERKFRRTI
jgi:hypothetical protein